MLKDAERWDGVLLPKIIDKKFSIKLNYQVVWKLKGSPTKVWIL